MDEHGGDARSEDDREEDARREVLYVNTGGHEDGLESQLVRYARAGHLRNWQWDRRRRRLWYDGQLEVAEVLREARRVAASSAGLVHTRDAGL